MNLPDVSAVMVAPACAATRPDNRSIAVLLRRNGNSNDDADTHRWVSSPAEHRPPAGVRRVAILLADGVDECSLDAMEKALAMAGMRTQVLAPTQGCVVARNGRRTRADRGLDEVSSLMFDAVYVPAGAASVAVLQANGDARHFIRQAYHSGKTIGSGDADGLSLIFDCGVSGRFDRNGRRDCGVITESATDGTGLEARFVRALLEHGYQPRARTGSSVGR